MLTWHAVSLLGPGGALQAPGRIADEFARDETGGGLVLVGHPLGRLRSYAHLLCHHLGRLGRPWAAESELAVAHDPRLLRLARRSGCRAVVLELEPEILRDAGGQAALRAAAADLRRIRRAGLLTVVDCPLGRPGDDVGIFGRVVWVCIAGRVTFPRLGVHPGPSGMSATELTHGLAWARRVLHSHRAIWRRSGVRRATERAALVANYRVRREVLAAPALETTPAMRLARALARPIRIRERVPLISTLMGAVQARGGQVRSLWCRARAMREERLAALVIRLEGAIDARAARKLVARVRRAIGRTPERIVVDLEGLEQVSLTVLTRFLDEHAGRLAQLRGRLAFRHLQPALAAIRRNLHGVLPNAALLEQALEEAR